MSHSELWIETQGLDAPNSPMALFIKASSILVNFFFYIPTGGEIIYRNVFDNAGLHIFNFSNYLLKPQLLSFAYHNTQNQVSITIGYNPRLFN